MPTETTVEVELVLVGLEAPAERLVAMQVDCHIDLGAACTVAAVSVHVDLVPLKYLTGRSSAVDRLHSHLTSVAEADRNETSLAVAELDLLVESFAGSQKARCYGWETPGGIPD